METKTKQLLQDTSTFLSQTQAQAHALVERFGKVQEQIPAYDLDYENFACELLNLCKSYDHLD